MKKLFVLFLLLVLTMSLCSCGYKRSYEKGNPVGSWECKQVVWGIMERGYTLDIYENGTAIMNEADGSMPVEMTVQKMTRGYSLKDESSISIAFRLTDANTLEMDYPLIGTLVFKRVSNQPNY